MYGIARLHCYYHVVRTGTDKRRRAMRTLTVCLLITLTSPLVQADDWRALTWNIWHGGREDSATEGPQRVIDVVRASQADIIAVQESYGSGEILAKGLGFHLHQRGKNVSILSRYPIKEDLSVFEEFKCVGALIERPNGECLAFFSIWLPYQDDIWLEKSRDALDSSKLLAACKPSAEDLLKLRQAIEKRLAHLQYAGIPVIVAGDFNSMSHLDYTSVWRDQHRQVIEWPTSRVLMDAGFRDAYRETNPHVQRVKDRTWSPRFPTQEQDRIDFIYYRGNRLQCISSQVIDHHVVKFPSDHAAVLAVFRDVPPPAEDVVSRVVTYNIRHGRGNDDKVQLDRTASVLQQLQPDVIGLQEVDWLVKRSGKVNQPSELGKRLGMHAAFGSFMDYQGGRYGLAVLSKYPIQRVEEVTLPLGNEPRVALMVEIRLPNAQSLLVVNVHFDWVDDDKFRYAQASALVERLKQEKRPYILLGDFNATPKTRTIDLLKSLATEIAKPAEQPFTFHAQKPQQEIDYIFASPATRWKAQSSRVIPEAMASDHRPYLAELILSAPPRKQP